MLCRQRTFFLSKNQYESVVLVYLNLSSGRPWFRIYHEDEAPRYVIHYRSSSDLGSSWTEWSESAELAVSSGDYTDFSFTFAAGVILQVYVTMVGDEKDPSDPSNTLLVMLPNTPIYSPPAITAFPYYYGGHVYAAVRLSVVEAFPSGVSGFQLWRRISGEEQWTSIGGTTNFWARDQYSEDDNETYEFIACWLNTDYKPCSDFSAITSVTLPEDNTTYLLPPQKLGANFYDFTGYGYDHDYYNGLNSHKGDIRSTGYRWQYRINNGSWSSSSDYDFEAAGVKDMIAFTFYLGHTNRPTTGDVWEYRLKNYAEGYTDSEWSEIFSITIPSLLERLASPVVRLVQTGYYVIVGWDAVANASGYKIERKLATATDYTVIVSSLPASTTQYTDTGTWAANTYDYRVTALGDNQTYQDSIPTVQRIYISDIVVLEAPVIDSITENTPGVDITISNINTPNTDKVIIEMSENNGAWTVVARGYPASQSDTTVTITVPGETILEGGSLRFRVYCTPAAMAQEDSPYSEISTITIAEREWLLRWTGSAWDYCTSVTGGWSSPTITYSDDVIAGNVSPQDQGDGVLRLQGTGFYMTGPLTSGRTALSTKYTKICMIGTLWKTYEGTEYHARFGNGHTYPFNGGTCIQNGTYVTAGSESGRGIAGHIDNPTINPVGQGTYSNSTGAHVYFNFNGGYADVKGIYAIKK